MAESSWVAVAVFAACGWTLEAGSRPVGAGSLGGSSSDRPSVAALKCQSDQILYKFH